MPEYLNAQEQRELLRLARAHFEARVRGEALPSLTVAGALMRPGGAFVTLTHGEDLRGCLGRIEPDQPLARTVAYLAAVVADEDYRFVPVRVTELEVITIEISVLTPPEEIQPAQVEVGRHGLIVEQGHLHGVLLPQVAVEHGWNREMFLSQTCVKAGLPLDAWRRGVRVRAFEAQVFSEIRR